MACPGYGAAVIVKRRATIAAAITAFLIVAAVVAVAYLRVHRERNRAQRQRAEALAAAARADDAAVRAIAESNRTLLLYSADALATDPTTAIARLRGMDPLGPGWPAARLLAERALAEGAASHVLAGHRDPPLYLAFAPDGRLAALDDGGGLRVWDLGTGEVVVLEAAPGGEGLAWTPDGHLRAWTADELRTWALPSTTPSIVAGEEEALAARRGEPPALDDHAARADMMREAWERGLTTPDGRQALLYGEPGTSRVYRLDRPNGALLVGVPFPRQQKVVLSPDGRWVASGGDRGLEIWDAGTAAHRVLGRSERVTAFAFRPGGGAIAAAIGKRVIEYDLATGDELRAVDGGRALAYSPDGKLLASLGGENAPSTVHVGDGVRDWTLRGHAEATLALAFSPDGRHLATSSRDRIVRVWDVDDLRRRQQTLAIASTSMAAGADSVVAGDEDGVVTLWAPDLYPKVVSAGPSAVVAVALSWDGRVAAAAYADGEVRRWDAASEGDVAVGVHPGVRAATVLSDGRIASLSDDGSLIVWDQAGPITHATRPLDPGCDAWEPIFSPAGDRVALIETDFECRTSVVVRELATGRGRHLDGAAGKPGWAGDGAHLVAPTADGDLLIFDVTTDAPGRRIQLALPGLEAAAFSADGSHAAAIGGMKIAVVDVFTGKPTRYLDGTFNAALFSPAGDRLATEGTRLFELDGGTSYVVQTEGDNLAFTTGGLWLVTGGYGPITAILDDLPETPAGLSTWLRSRPAL
jgi:WD40 repeat protein